MVQMKRGKEADMSKIPKKPTGKGLSKDMKKSIKGKKGRY